MLISLSSALAVPFVTIVAALAPAAEATIAALAAAVGVLL